MPVVELMPVGVVNPKACVSRSKSDSSAPGSTRATRAIGSTRTDFIADRSIIRPPSQAALPAMLWPPPLTASRSWCSRAKFTARMTSAAPAARTIAAGRRSIMPFHNVRDTS
jgi:hypothetical protein